MCSAVRLSVLSAAARQNCWIRRKSFNLRSHLSRDCIYSAPPRGLCDRTLELWCFSIVSMCLVEDLKVYSSQLITCYWDGISTARHTRSRFTAGEKKIKTAGEPSIGRRRRAPKKKWLDFRRSPPRVRATSLFNLKRSRFFFLRVIKTRVGVCPLRPGPRSPLQWHQLPVCQASHVHRSLPTTSHCSRRWLAARAWSAGRKSIAEDLQTEQGESSRNWPAGHCQSPNTKCKASQPWTDAISRQKPPLGT